MGGQKERLEAIARHRNMLRKEHAKYGKELHEKKFGADAAAQQTQLQAVWQSNRKQLGLKTAELEAERTRLHAEDHAARSASAGRVRQQSGLHVPRPYSKASENRNRRKQETTTRFILEDIMKINVVFNLSEK